MGFVLGVEGCRLGADEGESDEDDQQQAPRATVAS